MTIAISTILASTLLIDTNSAFWNISSDSYRPSSSFALPTVAPLLAIGVTPMFLILPYIDM